MSTNLLEKFSLDTDLFGTAIDNPEWFESSSTTTTLRVGKEVAYSATLNGKPVQAFVTLHSAKLTRLSLLQQNQISTGDPYWLATGILNPVKMDVEVLIDGVRMNIIDLMFEIAKQSSNNNSITREEFLVTARKMGFNFQDGMSLFFQQFGADYDKFAEAIGHFKQAGAVDVLPKIKTPKRIKAAYQLDKGVEITSFELGTVDRSKSTRNQGFLNLVDATFDQFTRIISLRKEARILMAEAEKNAGNWKTEKMDAVKVKIDELLNMSKQWTSNWAGAQQRIVTQEGGSLKTENIYDPVNAPCGRFTMIVDGNPVEVDLWTNSARANKSEDSTATSTAEILKSPF
jgi:hypothetical protein